MANTFPTLSSGSMKVQSPLTTEAIAMYPSNLVHSFVVRKIRFLSDQEQRWVVRNELFNGVLQYHSMSGYDTSRITAFFRTIKGAYVSPTYTGLFDITIDGINYQNCCFDQDAFSPTTDRSDTFSFQLAIRQLKPNS